MDDSAIMCDEYNKETVPIKLNEYKANCKMQNFYILLAYLLITTALLRAVSICCTCMYTQTVHATFSMALSI